MSEMDPAAAFVSPTTSQKMRSKRSADNRPLQQTTKRYAQDLQDVELRSPTPKSLASPDADGGERGADDGFVVQNDENSKAPAMLGELEHKNQQSKGNTIVNAEVQRLPPPPGFEPRVLSNSELQAHGLVQLQPNVLNLGIENQVEYDDGEMNQSIQMLPEIQRLPRAPSSTSQSRPRNPSIGALSVGLNGSGAAGIPIETLPSSIEAEVPANGNGNGVRYKNNKNKGVLGAIEPLVQNSKPAEPVGVVVLNGGTKARSNSMSVTQTKPNSYADVASNRISSNILDHREPYMNPKPNKSDTMARMSVGFGVGTIDAPIDVDDSNGRQTDGEEDFMAYDIVSADQTHVEHSIEAQPVMLPINHPHPHPHAMVPPNGPAQDWSTLPRVAMRPPEPFLPRPPVMPMRKPRYSKMQNTMVRTEAFIPRLPESALLTIPRKPYKCLHNEILDFVSFLLPTQAEYNARLDLAERLDAIMKSLYDNAEIEVFGSVTSGLALPSSDMDVVVFNARFASNMIRLANNLKSRGYNSVQVIDKARVCDGGGDVISKVPIVKFVDPETDIRVDVSFGQESGPKNTFKVKMLLKDYAMLRPLTMVVKYYLDMLQLNEPFSGGLGSYALTVMVTSCIQNLQNTPGFDGDLGTALKHLLYLYGNSFNYHELGICVRPEASPYFNKRERVIAANDLGRGTYQIGRIRDMLMSAYNALAATEENPTPNMLILIHGQAYHNVLERRQRFRKKFADRPPKQQ